MDPTLLRYASAITEQKKCWELLAEKFGWVQTDTTLLTNNSQHCWMLHFASVCTPCCMLLDVVACCCAKFETSQTFQPTTPNISFVPWSPKCSATMLDPFAQLFQHCWGRARSLRKVYQHLWVVCFPRCTAGPNIVGSCCIRLHAALVEKTSIKGLTVIFVYVIDYSWNCMAVSFEKTCGVSSCAHL